MKSLSRLLVTIALLLAAAVPLGCGGAPAATTTTVATPPPPPPPAGATTTSPTATAPTTAPATIAPATTTTTTEPVTTPAPTTTPEGLRFITTESLIDFPNSITFTMTAAGNVSIESASVRYGSDAHSLVPETQKGEPDITLSVNVTASWKWDMKKTGSLPPGATVWWQWTVTDTDGNTVSAPRQEMQYLDIRFQWQQRDYPLLDVYWHDQPDDLIQELLDALDTHLARIHLDVTIPPERKPKVFVYRDSAELREAVLFQQDWTGALAFPSYNIILTAVNPQVLDWARDTLPHEVTHLLIGEMVFGPFGNIPTWLNEGLAEYSVPDASYTRGSTLQDAITTGTLISLKSLGGGFPTDPGQALLGYAESRSVVAYLLEQYGWDKMNALLAVYRDGATNDAALNEVYGLDLDELEQAWRTSIGAGS